MSLNLVVVGTSIISDYFIDALKQTSGFTLYGIFSRSLDKAQAMAERHHAPKAYADWSALLKDPAVDVVYVATPNDLHAPQSIQLMEAGKHVICEKPYVLNLNEFTQVQATSERTQRFCFDAITTLHLPNLEHARSALSDILPLKLFSSSMVQYSSRYDALLANTITNIFDPNHGGGALMDLGVYPITLAVALLGTPTSIHYEANCIFNGIDTSGVLVMDYETFKASLVFGKDSHGPNATHIAGEKGLLHLPMQPSRFTGVELILKNTLTQRGVEQVPNPMMYEIQAFADILAANDWSRYRELMKLTRGVIAILDEGRRQIGLRFPQDTPTNAA